ncbi:M16 family metallopeptidase [Lampropedia aestuarii]|uniref:M16 family metallopeptidase n=1 Tax=Lampropedia aestuarii TaxID=2562762 RepID=UPI0024685F31|nr:pitrilysin family protein [Lampropedia aestuarii]MDH5857689.1 pitrilysin family protein [Lampropedia aestuarii]
MNTLTPSFTSSVAQSRTTRLVVKLCAIAALSTPLWSQAETKGLLPITHWQQANGAQIWLVQSDSLPMVDVQIDFDGGQRRNPANQIGLASATASMLGKGVKAAHGRPALNEDQLGEAWADLGASFGASASSDRFTFRLRSLTDSKLLPQATALAAQQIGQPAWPAPVWERERAQWSAAIREAQTRPGTIANDSFAKAVYGNHPYGYITTPQSLQNMDTNAMQAFYAQHVQPCRAKATVVGNVNKAQADQLVSALLADLPANSQCASLPSVAEVAPLTKATEQRIPFASEQAQVLIGQPGIKRDDPDFLTLLVANHILGGSGFGSRLMEEVREKRGLVYGVYSGFSPGNHAGAFTIGLQTRADQAEEAAQLVHEIVADFVANGPTEKELQDAKANLIGGFALRIDSNEKLLGNVANIAWNDLPLDYLNTWSDKVQAITVEDIRTALKKHLQPEAMVTVVVGGAAS